MDYRKKERFCTMPRKETKRLILEQLPPEERGVLEFLGEEFRPTRRQYHHWRLWVNWKLAVDPEGWFYGWCPISDPHRQSPMSAQFSFAVGSMRCNHDEVCHTGKRAISLYNVEKRMVENAKAK